MIYLDHHSTTPVDERVLQVMLPFFREHYGNASSRQHAFGWKAEQAVEKARAQVAALIGASDPKEVVFTGSATEANNLAVAGAESDHVVSVATEHSSIRSQLRDRKIATTEIVVDAQGYVSASAIEAALTEETQLVCVMLANNEIGTIQPLEEIAQVCAKRGVWLLSDAVQAAGHIPVDVTKLGVDLMSLSAHKMYGPKGVGALWIRRSRPQVLLQAQTFGGGHERALRAGTLNVPGIVGFGEAARIALEDIGEPRVRTLRDRLQVQLFERIPGLLLNGPLEGRLPGNLNVSVPGLDGETLLLEVSKDLAVSSGSACSSGTQQVSHVLRAIGRSDELAHASLRFGIGRTNLESEIDTAANVVVSAVERLRASR